MSSGSRKKRQRERTPPPIGIGHLGATMEAILSRLTALEQRRTSPEAPPDAAARPIEQASAPARGPCTSAVVGTEASSTPRPTEPRASSVAPSELFTSPCCTTATPSSSQDPTTERLIEALRSLNPVRSTHYYVSDFDPSIHDVNAWCDEVDRARAQNNWDEKECLARVGSCLRGDARAWLRDWGCTDRNWVNFKSELKALCPRRIDIANILFDVMCTESDKYSTYADYARKSLLRLRIVNGLSDDLLCAIIVRGIKDPQIRASATNAKLTPESIVEFLSTYVMPLSRSSASNNYNSARNSHSRSGTLVRDKKDRKRNASSSDSARLLLKCYNCKQFGHKSINCSKRLKLSSDSDIATNVNNSNQDAPRSFLDKPHCNFCKKIGHSEEECFTKQRSLSRNKANVNFCREIVNKYNNQDVISAVLCGVPTDVLIDSGSCISLISKDLLNHFSCRLNRYTQILYGLNGTEVRSDFYVTLPIEFDEVTLEIDFHVVPSGCLSTPVLIGTDVLNRPGIAYIRTGNLQRIMRDSGSVNNVTIFNIDEANSLSTPLCGKDRERLNNVLRKYSDFFLSGTATTTVKTGQMHIRLTSDVPVNYRPYKMSHDEKLRVRAIVSDLKQKGIIRESESAYSSPVLLVKKKNGEDRMVVDYRALNNITIKDRFPLPLIDDHIDRLGKCKLFTALDMVTGFHQIKVSEDSVDKTAFVTPEGHFEYLKMPYGLANAPVVYQRIISSTLRPFIESGQVLAYIDDVLLLSNTIDEGLSLLDAVLKLLTESGFSINLRKCSFLTNEVEYLGRTISNGQVRPSTHKIEALTKSPKPQNVKQVRQFLGLAGYFRRYIPGYAAKTAPIAILTRKNIKFHWGDEQERARREIIDHLTSAPVLTIFDPSLETEVHTDASSLGYGAVLLQTHSDGRKHAVAYFSKVTTGAEPRYHSYELETLAVVKALQHFRHYLIGKHFKVITDCNALKMTQRKKDLQPRVARLQDFDFVLEYRKGAMLPHADYLSRNAVNVVTARKPLNWAQLAQSADEETLLLINKLQEGLLDSSRYVRKDDILYYKYSPVGEASRLLCYVPKAYRLSLLRAFHDEHQHIGTDKTLDLILKHFWFPGIRQFVRKYISHCIICIAHKKVPRAPSQPIVSWSKPSTPFETVHTDVLGPLPESNGYKFILMLIDSFSKYCLLYPIYRQDSAELVRVITNAISIFGTPRTLVCDRGRMFESNEFASWTSNFGIELHFITPEMHQSNGQIERYCRTVLNMIRVEVNHRSELWSDVLWKLQLALNITKQKTTQASALNLLIGTDSTTPVIQSLVRDLASTGSSSNREARRELRRQRAENLLTQNQAAQDARVNQNRSPPKTFALNDSVFVIKRSQCAGKLDSGMRGPYRVIKILPNGRYELRLIAGSYGKTTQAAAEYMVPWQGEWTPETCSAFFENDDHDEPQPITPATSDAGPPAPETPTTRVIEVTAIVERVSSEASEDAGPSGEAVLAAPPTEEDEEDARLPPRDRAI